jgi:hypothetical protein
VLGIVWLGVCARLVVRRRLDCPSDLAASSGWVLIASVLLLTSAVFAHYLVPAVALAAVSDDERLHRGVVWLSVGGLAAYAVELLGLTLGSAWLGSASYRLIGSLILLGPVAAMWLAPRAAQRRRRR